MSKYTTYHAKTDFRWKKNNSYSQFKFQVIAVNAEGVSEPLECVDAFIPENPFGTPGAPGKPEQIGGDFDSFEVKYEVSFQKNLHFIFLYIGFWIQKLHFFRSQKITAAAKLLHTNCKVVYGEQMIGLSVEVTNFAWTDLKPGDNLKVCCEKIYVTIMYCNDELSWTISWFGCLLTD